MPFTRDQFLEVFARYNEAIWPAQWALSAVGVAVVVLAFHGGPRAGRAAVALLALLWLWAGVAYHALAFAPMSPAGYAFAALFVVQAVLLARAAARRAPPRFDARADLTRVTGALMALYALIVYPLVGALVGHDYPRTPTFGAPCPVTILTLGVLLWAAPTAPRRLLAIPALWAAIATTVALRFGMVEDYALPVAAVLAAALSATRPRGSPTVARTPA